MALQGNNSPSTMSVEKTFNDQHFLLNFIMSTYLGPDVFFDNPRRSASQRLAQALPPYTSNSLGFSFVSLSQLESLYNYVLRNANPALVVQPSVFHMYVKGIMPLPSSELPEDCQQFTSFFPLNIHGHKRYSGRYEIVKGIVLIDDPDTSFIKKEDLVRFRSLSGMDDLKIDKIKSLCYEHEYKKRKEDGKQNYMKNSKANATGNISDGNHNSSSQSREPCMERHPNKPLPEPALSHPVSVSNHHILQGAFQKNCNRDGPAMMPLLTVPNGKECMSDASVTLTGTATKGMVGPPIGVVDIGISKLAYFFQAALPGVRRDYSHFSCEIEADGKVHIQGSTSGGKTIRKRSRVFRMRLHQICPPGQFTLDFSLPGPVDPRLFSPHFRCDGIFEAVVIKQK
ncbi:hypothetical protein AB3S75_013540 [Citrus x aurantiifolia]